MNNTDYQPILDNIPDIAWFVDVSGVFVTVNKAFLDLYHCTPEQIIGKTYYDFLDPKTAARYVKEDDEVVESKQKKVLECNIEISVDGWLETQWIETILMPAFDPEDPETCIGVVGIGRDVSERKSKIRLLQEQQEWLKLYFELPLIGMATIKEDQYWLDINQKFCSILGYSRDELQELKLSDLVVKKHQEKLLTALKDITDFSTEHTEVELEMTHQDSHIIFVHMVIHCMRLENEHNLVIMMDDISERKQAEQNLHLANKVINSSTEAIMITDHKSDIVRVNSAFCHLTGYEENEVLGRNPRLLQSGRNTKQFYQDMWESITDTGHWEGEIWDRRKDGTTYPKWMNISSIARSGTHEVTHYVAMFSDMSERKKTENQIRYLAYHDSLTGLPNRTFMEERLIRAIIDAEVEKTHIALIQLDLDNFKTINDSMGHYIGDQLLKEVGQRLEDNFRDTDIVARLGGDEFLIMLDKLNDTKNIKQLAENLLKAFEEQFKVLNYTMHITPSVGIVTYPQDGENHETLLQNVDTAMFRAKKNGRNQFVFFTKDMTKEVLKRITLEYQLRLAMESNELSVYYQPQIDLLQEKIIGVEALIRWKRHDTMISPVEFIPVAEESGLITSIGEWVLERACHDCKSWHDKGYPIKVAVNLAAQQFEAPYLINLVKRVLSETGLLADDLDLEITEGTLMHNSNSAIQILNELKEMGVKLSIDDFGTGYSSLAYLKAFNVDKLKIDRSFITGLPDDKDDAAITTTIIQLAKNLGMKIIAEGAETKEHIDFLREQKCDQIQGYYYGKPMPESEFFDFLSNWNK
ncbi:MAG: EAL domain-containing protein [Gammaproteobacteria bacterium]|nr:EAL domain-containing protein [Gammaproteobacteria bacterium]MDH5591313.1 EAL domain-containing protein [Gammaproteobacteria bacterium]